MREVVVYLCADNTCKLGEPSGILVGDAEGACVAPRQAGRRLRRFLGFNEQKRLDDNLFETSKGGVEGNSQGGVGFWGTWRRGVGGEGILEVKRDGLEGVDDSF